MTSRFSRTAGDVQRFRWTVLLLGIAVLLPTVCLLWLMSHAVANERLAVRQKLIDSYRFTLSEQLEANGQAWLELTKRPEEFLKDSPYLWDQVLTEQGLADGLLIYGRKSHKLFYPVQEAEVATSGISAQSAVFRDASRAEFVQADPEAAAEVYRRIAAGAEDQDVRLRAEAGLIRCLKKAGREDEAIAASKTLLKREVDPFSVESVRMVFNIRLGLIQLFQQTGSPELEQVMLDLTEAVIQQQKCPTEISRAQKQRVLSLTESMPKTPALEQALNRVQLLADAEGLSLAAAERNSYFPREPRVINRMSGKEPLFGYTLEAGKAACIILLSQETLADYFNTTLGGVFPPDLCARIYDEEGELICSTKETRCEALLSQPLGPYFSGWTIALHPVDDCLFQNAAGRQAALYVWTAALVILLFLLAGTASVVMLNRQMKLNRLKNDFIATVSHELKTPLASMRVLMDTLFEGHYELPEPVEEYLQMISRDNLRLTRLVDSFLTFSRMERNKHSFAIVGTEVEPIVRSAVNAVKARLSDGECRFELELPESLPPVLADGDALVLVLINLLDNAYKYSEPPCHIRLRVSAEEKELVFEVQDNGIGMTPRAARRIFDRFYQVDQRLVREVEGCGLGLSIVKYIVDAHDGSIQVESRPGEGSTFRVKIPRA